ncbi:thiamine-phosphate kinase [Aquidulcibacter sp.]|uniref:thiamine-phosphate kinase n=1 Tax=Aquidulcibacter sp. TaxID=2052990 RepID=UPI0025BF7DED|nr:thiamine-phosphate kinase [Aquidulcibacter sp.]MCA3695254.1 thiamine-phosphate kinase [Aquidulcibacter sp.]
MEPAPPEFDLIAQLWAPLTLGAPGAFGLKDDVAQLSSAPFGHVVTCDQIIENTHFLPSDPLDWVAKRLVRRNLSDLIAKGCKPIGAFLSVAWPRSRPYAHLTDFAAGLGQDLAELCGACPLLGGDTSTTQGPLVASLTLIGAPLSVAGQPILRSGAQASDLIFLTGTIGDPYLGLQVRLGLMDGQGLEGAVAIALAPSPPPLAVAAIIATHAKASIDISDGLLADAGHVAAASGLALELDLERVPLSAEARVFLDRAQTPVEALLSLVTGGDDYQALTCVAPADAEAFASKMMALGVKITQIGVCGDGQGLTLFFHGERLDLPARTGWQFSGA